MGRKHWLIFAAGATAAVLSVVTIRFFAYSPKVTHYHANFALYVNSLPEEFTSPTLYEEVQTCSLDHHADPKSRVHMHDRTSHVIHVHDDGVTWGHFFANIGYGLTDKSLQTPQGLLVNAGESHLVFFLNGEVVSSIANRVIKSGDALLIVHQTGETPKSVLDERFAAIPKDAEEYNRKSDPASCKGSAKPSWRQRLIHALDLQN